MPDLLANEQTWPTEEEMMGAQDAETEDLQKRVKRVPKGTSAYQAAWIFDDDDDDEEEGGDDDGDVGSDIMEGEAMESGMSSLARLAHPLKDMDTGDDAEELEEVQLDARSEAHQEMTAEEEEAQ